jgi:protein phosphatase
MTQVLIDPRDVPTWPGEAGAERPRFTVRCSGLTHPGRVRERNEDQFLIAELTKSMRVKQSSLSPKGTHYGDDQAYLFVVADGMGGHQAGEHASALAVQTLEEFMLNTFKWFFQLRGREERNVLAEFQAALHQADARVVAEAERNPDCHGMGTTLTTAYYLEGKLFIVHVGDSRCYLLRDGRFDQITTDHTLVEEMVRQGQLRPDEAAHHHLRHVITNVIGGNEEGLNVEAHRVTVEPGDVLLLCSDGLTEMVEPERIQAVLESGVDPDQACRRLVDEANAQGGRDNITVIVARFDPS